eukprot:6181637-Pleurochrysis_carterae.AAC.2
MTQWGTVGSPTPRPCGSLPILLPSTEVVGRGVMHTASIVVETDHLIGNLWRMSTAKLEARGNRCKFVVRRQTSACPRAADSGKA